MDESRFDTDVVVVGAGLGGLAAAAHLVAVGKRVVVVEQHSVPGGNATVFTHEGYEFDVGVHYLGDCGPGGGIPAVLERLGIDVTFLEMDPDGFDTLVFPDMAFKVPRGAENYRANLHRAFPAEAEGVDAYVDTIVGLTDELRGKRDPEYLGRHTGTTLGGFFDELGLSARCRTVLGAEHGTYAVPPSQVSLLLHSALMMHYLADGAFYPKGGGQVIADGLADFIVANGGRVILRTPVEQVIVEGGRVAGVRLRPPSPERRRGVPDEIRAPVVISNADLKRTVTDLIGSEHFPDGYVEKVVGYEMSLPLFVVYLVLDRDLRAEGLPVTNYFAIHDDDIEAEYRAITEGRMPDQPGVYLSLASLKDPGNANLCRPGQTNLQVMAVAPPDYRFWGLEKGPVAGERYRTNEAYRRRRKEVGELLVEMADLALPGIVDDIAYMECATPITHERFIRSTGGTSYGIAATPDQFFVNRPGHVTPLPGLFLAGASTITGHGIAGAMSSGEAVASAICEASVAELVGDRFVGS